MLQLLVFATLTTAMFYLGSRARITEFLWSRYPSWLVQFMDCPACSGAWYGLAWAYILRWVHHPLPPFPTEWWGPLVMGLASSVWTTLGAALHQWAFEMVGNAHPEQPEE